MRCRTAHRRFDRLVDGRLDPAQAAAVWEHALRCAGCQAELTQRRELDRRLRDALAPVAPPTDLAPGLVERMASIRNRALRRSLETGPDLPLDVALSRTAAALLAWTVTALGGAWAWLSVQAGGPDEAARQAGAQVLAGLTALTQAVARLPAGDLVPAVRKTLQAWLGRPAGSVQAALDMLTDSLAWAASHPSTAAVAGLAVLVIGIAGLWQIHRTSRGSGNTPADTAS